VTPEESINNDDLGSSTAICMAVDHPYVVKVFVQLVGDENGRDQLVW
jgi:hypothetical protein